MPKSVADEIEKFDDVIIGDFFDSYQNLTLKTWTGHRFVNSKYFKDCQTADWVIFHDDDAFVDYYQVHIDLNLIIYYNIIRVGLTLRRLLRRKLRMRFFDVS